MPTILQPPQEPDAGSFVLTVETKYASRKEAYAALDRAWQDRSVSDRRVEIVDMADPDNPITLESGHRSRSQQGNI